jgi:hypothetical protein
MPHLSGFAATKLFSKFCNPVFWGATLATGAMLGFVLGANCTVSACAVVERGDATARTANPDAISAVATNPKAIAGRFHSNAGHLSAGSCLPVG